MNVLSFFKKNLKFKKKEPKAITEASEKLASSFRLFAQKNYQLNHNSNEKG